MAYQRRRHRQCGRIEERLEKSGFGRPQQAAMIQKWVEWRHGKPKEKLEHSGSKDGAPNQIISHIPRPGDEPGPGEDE